MISTGLSSIIDNNYFAKLAERGSTGSKGMALRCGVVDPSYRGEWFVGITNTNNVPIVICKEKAKDFFNETYSKYREYVFYPYEKAIAQAIVLPMCPVGIAEINEEELNGDVTERGAGKLGSSGKYSALFSKDSPFPNLIAPQKSVCPHPFLSFQLQFLNTKKAFPRLHEDPLARGFNHLPGKGAAVIL